MECDSRRSFGLDIGFIHHLHKQQGTTSNYNAIDNLHISKITTAHSKSFPACCDFTKRCLVTAYNSRDSSDSALKSSLNGGSLPTDSFLHRLPYRTDSVKSSLMLQPTDSRPVCLGIKHPSGAYDQIFISVRQLRVY
jgi:hypothetical protein